MCRKNVILFDCGHTRKLNITSCNNAGIECHNPERILIPEGGGIGIQTPKDKVTWTCIFGCVPGQAAHDPLIELAKENADAVKMDIEQKIEVLSILSTPFSTPGTEKGGFDFSFDQRFVKGVNRRLQNAASAPKARDDLTFNFTNMKLKIPDNKFRGAAIKEEVQESE